MAATNEAALAERRRRAVDPAWVMLRLLNHRELCASGCWLYVGYRDAFGYGTFYWRGVTTKAHRAAYLLWVGPLERGAEIHHRCGNKSCFNPEHLQRVDRKEHFHLHPDPLAATRVTGRKSCCRRGHPLNAETAWTYSYGQVCKECQRLRQTTAREKRHGERAAAGNPVHAYRSRRPGRREL